MHLCKLVKCNLLLPQPIFRAAVASPNMLDNLISHSARRIFPRKTKGVNFPLTFEVTSQRALVFHPSKPKFLRRQCLSNICSTETILWVSMTCRLHWTAVNNFVNAQTLCALLQCSVLTCTASVV